MILEHGVNRLLNENVLVQPKSEWSFQRQSDESFTFYHLDARVGDQQRIYELGKTQIPQVFTGLSWLEDHLVVRVGRNYLDEAARNDQDRFARAIYLIVSFYRTRRLLKDITSLDELDHPNSQRE